MSDTLYTPRFHVIGTQANAWRDASGGVFSTIKSGSGVSNASVSSSSDTGAFGSSMIQKTSGLTVIRALCYPGRSNWSDASAFSVLMRIIPRWSGAPSGGEQALFNAQFGATAIYGIYAVIGIDGGLYFGYYDQYGTAYSNPNTERSIFTGFTSGTTIDLLITCDGTTVTYYAGGSSVGSFNLAASNPSINNQNIGNLIFGTCPTGGTLSNYDVNELAVWDYALSSGDITNLNARSTFLATTECDATAYTDPGTANVLNTTTYTFAGVSETGTAASSTDPGVANVFNGVNYNINGVSKTGTGVASLSLGLSGQIVVIPN